jgi:hypothetical protein
MVLASGRLTMILGASGSVPISKMDTVSRPGALMTPLPASSQLCYSSLPTIISCRLPAIAGAVVAVEHPASADRHNRGIASMRILSITSPFLLLPEKRTCLKRTCLTRDRRIAGWRGA